MVAPFDIQSPTSAPTAGSGNVLHACSGDQRILVDPAQMAIGQRERVSQGFSEPRDFLEFFFVTSTSDGPAAPWLARLAERAPEVPDHWPGERLLWAGAWALSAAMVRGAVLTVRLPVVHETGDELVGTMLVTAGHYQRAVGEPTWAVLDGRSGCPLVEGQPDTVAAALALRMLYGVGRLDAADEGAWGAPEAHHDGPNPLMGFYALSADAFYADRRAKAAREASRAAMGSPRSILLGALAGRVEQLGGVGDPIPCFLEQEVSTCRVRGRSKSQTRAELIRDIDQQVWTWRLEGTAPDAIELGGVVYLWAVRAWTPEEGASAERPAMSTAQLVDAAIEAVARRLRLKREVWT